MSVAGRVAAAAERSARVARGAAASRRRGGTASTSSPTTSLPSSSLAARSGALLRRRRGGIDSVRPRAVMEDRNEVLEQILETIRNASANNSDPDYFELLGVEVSTDPKVIKKAYRERARVCHPDIAGEDGHEACVVLNEAYATLMDDDLREAYALEKEELDYYDDGNVFAEAMKETPYTGEPLSKTVPLDHFANKIDQSDPKKTGDQINKAVFVDEMTCIGCGLCVTAAPATFRNDDETGRARVFGQWLSTEDEIQEAIDMCPVDCIHWLPKEQLAPLEYVTQVVITERVGVSMMMAGQGSHRMQDVFQKSKEFLKFLSQREEKREMIIKERRRKAEQKKAREDMMKANQANWEQNKAKFWK